MLRKFRSHARKVVLKYFSHGRYKRAHFVVVFICFYKVIGNVKIHCYPLFLPSLHLCELSWIKTSTHESAREWMSGWTLLGFWMITISLLLLLIQHWADDTLSTLFWFSLCILSHFILSTFVLPSFLSMYLTLFHLYSCCCCCHLLHHISSTMNQISLLLNDCFSHFHPPTI